jgi:hypothetical protein
MPDISDDTLVMGPDELHSARGLSVEGLEPLIHIPGYEEERFLGKGAFGEAWSALDSNSGRRVVIKFFNRRGGLDWSLLAREVDKLRYLFSDRRIVQLFAVGWDATPPYYVMEYMEGGSLEQLLHAGPLALDRALELFREIAVGLAHAHGKGIIHCDLKPANVLLDQDGNPKLADFGQSRLSHEQGASLGTLFYMAPEQADLHAAPDARFDIYALGAILYHMLTGRVPYSDVPGADVVFRPGRLEDRLERYRNLLTTAPKPSAHRQLLGVDAALVDLVDRCLSLDPARRFRDVGSVLSALDARATRRAQRPLLVLGFLGPLLVVTVMAVGAVWMLSRIFSDTKRDLIRNAVEGDRFAARLLAQRFAREVEGRWRILEGEANEPLLQRLLATPAASANPGEVAAVRRWIDNRRSRWNREFSASTAAVTWFAEDRDGILRAISPHDDYLIGKYFGYRDYFHGLRRALLPNEAHLPPITRPRRSQIYMSLGQGRDQSLMVTFSVPVFAPGADEGLPQGVLAMETEVGHFTEFRGKPHQKSVLIDLRPDNEDKTGRIVAHELLEKRPKGARSKGFYVDAEILHLVERLRTARLASRSAPGRDARAGDAPAEDDEGVVYNYTDPLDASEGWLAVLEPVFLNGGADGPIDSDWFVLVQERYKGSIQARLDAMLKEIVVRATAALIAVVLVVGALWTFVIVVIKEGRASPWLVRWRGLPTPATSTSSSLANLSQTATRSRTVERSPAQAPAETPPQSLAGSASQTEEPRRWPS